MIRLIDEHKDRFGIEPLIGVLRGTDAGFLSVSGYYAAKVRPPSARAVADAALCEQISMVYAHYGVCGVRKLHAALRRDGVLVGRDRVGRLMRRLDLHGVRRGRAKRTTTADTAAARPADPVRWQFHAGPAEPAVGVRPDLPAHLGRLRLSGAGDRHVLPAAGRLGANHPATHRSAAGGLGDGGVGPTASRACGTGWLRPTPTASRIG